MRNLTIHTDAITEGFASNAIFDACRANEVRNPKGYVTFWRISKDESFAYLFNDMGEKIATVIVDKFDC